MNMWWIFLMVTWGIFVIAIVPMITGRRRRMDTTITVFLLTLPIVFIFTFNIMVGEDSPFDAIGDFFSYDDSSVVANYEDNYYDCSYFETTGSFAYLNAKYGSESLCDIYEYNSAWKVTCMQGTIPRDYTYCEKLESWK